MKLMTVQDLTIQPIHHFVVPVCRIYDYSYSDKQRLERTESVCDLVGNAYFVGSDGFAITASHVLKEIDREGGEKVILIQRNDGQWIYYRIIGEEHHPTEDIAIIKVYGEPWRSIMELSSVNEFASCEYDLWGYPDYVAKELENTTFSISGKVLIKPELIFQRGYIRRRITRELPQGIYVGSNFYEISAVAGARCSGAPIIHRSRRGANQSWQVIGTYIGEQTSTAIHAVGYAVRSSSIYDWQPSILGRSVGTEYASNLSSPNNKV
jgi:hypothetical protein